MDCAEARVSLGVYVLGAIEPAERALVESHLATCRDCRDELAGLAGLPALLSRVSTEEAIALGAADGPLPDGFGTAPEPPPELLATVLDLTAARRRRRRWLEAGIGAAAALIIAAGVFGGLRLGASPVSPPSAAVGQYAGAANGAWEAATGKSGAMTATVAYRSMGWGIELEAKVTGIPVGTQCQLWVIDSAGNRVLGGSWQTDSAEGAVYYPGSAALAGQDVASFQVTVQHGQAITVKT
jgi:anti-sigma factor RsiW